MSPFERVILHSLKYSGQDVYGVLLSRTNEPEKCVPLFHSPCVSRVMMRTALSLIEGMPGYKIVGLYFASNASTGVPPLARLIANQIGAVTGSTPQILRIDVSQSPGSDETISNIVTVVSDDENKRPTVCDINLDRLRQEIASVNYVNITDFEDFLVDPALEWICS